LGSQLEVAEFVPADYAIWNVVPWFLGSGDDARKPRAADLKDAEPHLETLVTAMEKNNLKCIVLVGTTARKVLLPLSKYTKVRIASIHHPLAQSMAREGARLENEKILKHLKRSV
jgi:uracil-DNA glycosylase